MLKSPSATQLGRQQLMYPATNSTATATLGSPVVATAAKSPTAANRKNIEFKK